MVPNFALMQAKLAVIDNFSHKKIYILSHQYPTGQTAYRKTLKMDSLNIEPRTFCGLIEIKEMVTE